MWLPFLEQKSEMLMKEGQKGIIGFGSFSLIFNKCRQAG
jgi:hypothetical protein